MKKLIFFFILFTTNTFNLFSQQNYTISGYILDKSSDEAIIGANIIISEISSGTISNTYGFYSITVPAGEYIFNYSILGYSEQNKKINREGARESSYSFKMTRLTSRWRVEIINRERLNETTKL